MIGAWTGPWWRKNGAVFGSWWWLKTRMRCWAYRRSFRTSRRPYRFRGPATSVNDLMRAVLWEQSADEGGFGDAADGQDHGAGARRNVVLAHGIQHFVESADHDLLQARVDFVRVPHQTFLVLHPLEVADGDAAG